MKCFFFLNGITRCNLIIINMCFVDVEVRIYNVTDGVLLFLLFLVIAKKFGLCCN